MEILLLSLPLHEHGYLSFICVFFNYIHQGPLLSSFCALSASQQSLPILQALLGLFEPIPCPAVRYHFLGMCVVLLLHIEETVCFCTHPKTKSFFLWMVPCQIYLDVRMLGLEKHCLEYSWFLIHDFKRINDKNSALGRVLWDPQFKVIGKNFNWGDAQKG